MCPLSSACSPKSPHLSAMRVTPMRTQCTGSSKKKQFLKLGKIFSALYLHKKSFLGGT
jgi:hypothetical protein